MKGSQELNGMKAVENIFPEFQGIFAGGEPDIDGKKNRRRHQVWKAWHPALPPASTSL
jgi:hypothetical protein